MSKLYRLVILPYHLLLKQNKTKLKSDRKLCMFMALTFLKFSNNIMHYRSLPIGQPVSNVFYLVVFAER